MKQSKQSGSILVIILAIVIVVLLGVIGWLAYKSFAVTNTAKTSTRQTTQATGTKPSTSAQAQQATSTLSISQLGIKLVNLPADLQHLSATPNADSPQYIDIYDKSASSTTSIASMSKVDGMFDGTGELQLAKPFSGYWISYQHPNGIISDPSVAAAVSAFGTYINDQANIQSL